MKNIYFLLFSLLYVLGLGAQDYDCYELSQLNTWEAGEMSVTSTNTTSLLGDGAGISGLQYPNGDGELANLIEHLQLIVTGKDESGAIHLNGLMVGEDLSYRERRGPLYGFELTPSGTMVLFDCEFWNRFFEMTDDDIQSFLSDWSDGVLDNDIPQALIEWPATGNPYFEDEFGEQLPSTDLAPFVDVNMDGIYDPALGDYPAIKGATQAIWSVLGFERGTAIEVQTLQYIYDDINTEVANTLFFDVKLLKFGFELLEDGYISLVMDPSIGCVSDDYVGCVPEENMVFAYNADGIDGTDCSCDINGLNAFCDDMPLVGVKILEGIYNPLIDQYAKMSSFLPYKNGSIGTPNPAETDPFTILDYYYNAKGLRKDGTAILDTNGEPTLFPFPGNPSDESQWSMCSSDEEATDYRAMLNIGPLFMTPDRGPDWPYGEGALTHKVEEISFAISVVPSVSYPCPDVTPLVDAMDEVEDFFNNQVLSTDEITIPNASVGIFPNPMSAFSTIELDSKYGQLHNVEIYTTTGQLLKSYTQINNQRLEIERENWSAGVYYCKITTTKGGVITSKLVVL